MLKSMLRALSSKIVLRIVVLSVLLGIFLTGYSVDAKKDPGITQVYHLYVDGVYIGDVLNDDVVQEVIAEKEAEHEAQNPNVSSAVSNTIEYVPEYVYEESVNLISEDELYGILSDLIEIKMTVTAIVVNGEPLIIMNSQEEAEEVLDKVIESVVGPDVVIDTVTPAPAPGQTIIRSVGFDKAVTIEEVAVTPTKIYTVDEAVAKIKGGNVETITYTVLENEDLEDISIKFGIPKGEIIELNPEVDFTNLEEGQQIKLETGKPLFNVKVEKEVNNAVKIPYAKETVEDPNMFKGETTVSQTGKDGSKNQVSRVTEINGQQVESDVIAEEIVVNPVNEVTVVGTKVIPSRGTGELAWPCNGGYISDYYMARGGSHKGIDIARPSNYTIKAADNGIVTYAGWDDSGYGNMIIIDHQNGMTTKYAHLESISVVPGQVVQKGQPIGVMGSTGRSTGVHLHFEVRVNGSLVDPLDYLDR